MSRKHPGRKIQRATERYLRSEGSKAFKRAADDQLKKKAAKLAAGLSKATIKKGSAAAAGLLVDLAEAVEYNDNPAAFDRAFSLAQKWASEPQMVPIDIIRPQLEDQPKQLQLTSGDEGIQDAEVSPAGPDPGSSPPPDTGPDDPRVLEPSYD